MSFKHPESKFSNIWERIKQILLNPPENSPDQIELKVGWEALEKRLEQQG